MYEYVNNIHISTPLHASLPSLACLETYVLSLNALLPNCVVYTLKLCNFLLKHRAYKRFLKIILSLYFIWTYYYPLTFILNLSSNTCKHDHYFIGLCILGYCTKTKNMSVVWLFKSLKCTKNYQIPSSDLTNIEDVCKKNLNLFLPFLKG